MVSRAIDKMEIGADYVSCLLWPFLTSCIILYFMNFSQVPSEKDKKLLALQLLRENVSSSTLSSSLDLNESEDTDEENIKP